MDPATISHALVLGEMTAGDLTAINSETGFGFPVDDDNIPVTAPADMYVRSFEYTKYLAGWRAGETDYSISFDVCSAEIDGAVIDAVEGQFHHITGLSPALEDLFADLSFTCEQYDIGTETLRSCGYSYGGEYHLIPEGTAIGTAGGTGGPSNYDPGLDFNLLDRRFTNVYVNPSRLGGAEGPGASYRYGVAPYEYFLAATRDAYSDKVGSIPQPQYKRVSADYPSGKLSGVGKAGTAAGVWIREDKTGLNLEDDLIDFLSHILVLADHNFSPDTDLMLSTDLTSIADVAGAAQLVQFPAEETGDLNTRFVNTAPGDTLLIERLDADCNAIAQPDRQVTVDAVRFTR